MPVKTLIFAAFFHINDVHSHLNEFISSGTDCTDPEDGCYGGYARVQTVINERRPVLNDSLFLNAGDEFQVSAIIVVRPRLSSSGHPVLFVLRR